MAVTTCSIYGPIIIILLLAPVVSSYTFCSWKPANIDTYPDAQLSFQCTDPSYPIIIIENAVLSYAYNTMNGNCTSFIGCSQQVTDFAGSCTGQASPCSLNQRAFYLWYASQTCNSAILNYVSVNYSCIAANLQPPYDICNTQQHLYSTGLTYLSSSSSFPLLDTFPYATIQCSCSFKPLYQGVTTNISIRALVVDFMDDYTTCSQSLTIRSCSSNDTVFCSRSVSSNVTSYVQLEKNPSISFQSNSTQGHFLFEIRTLTSSITGTIGSIDCSRNVVPSCGVSSSSSSVETTSRQSAQPTIQLASTSVSRLQTSRTTSHSSQSSNASFNIFTEESSTQNGTLDHRSTSITTNPILSQVVTHALPAPAHGDSNVSGGAIGGIVAGLLILAIIIIILIIGCLRKKSENTSGNIEDQKNKGTPLNGRGTPYVEPADVMKSSSDTSQVYQGLKPSTLEACGNNVPRNDEYQCLERPYDTRLDQLDDNKPNCPRGASYLEPVMEVHGTQSILREWGLSKLPSLEFQRNGGSQTGTV